MPKFAVPNSLDRPTVRSPHRLEASACARPSTTRPRTGRCAPPIDLLGLLGLLALLVVAGGCDRQQAAESAGAGAGTESEASAPAEGAASEGEAALATAAPGSILDCVAVGNARPICGFQSPEDIVALPGDEALVISGYGAMDAQGVVRKPGGLVLFSLADETQMPLYSGGSEADVAEAGWGNPACPAPPKEKFNAHGIDLVRRDDGRLALLVVQHFGREAIEFFEVKGAGKEWSLAWKGCVLAPADASLNEVVGLPNGDFYTTKMASISGASDFTAKMPTEPTGHAFAWSAATGYRKIEGTDGIMPNGIAASADGKTLYLNVTMQSEVRKVDVASGAVLATAAVKMPDNVTWAPDGKRLLVASLHGFETTNFSVCVDLPEGACPIPFAIQAVDAETMTPLGPVYESNGPPMGGGTVGLQVGSELFIGSFTGDRILRVQLPST
jgi:SMP-30/Gluconolactonase/LRE-like region